MSPAMPTHEAPVAALRIEGTCPECGAPFEAGLWDHSHRCEFCGSLLVSAREFGDAVFVVADMPVDPDPRLPIVRRAVEDFRSRLMPRAGVEGELELELPALLEGHVERHRAQLLESMHVVEALDFFAPYEIHEQTIVQGVLGRRRDAKESFIQCFRTEDLERRYDPSFNLRDVGLKIRGMGLQLVTQRHLELSGGRFLEVVPVGGDARPLAVRSRTRIRPGTQIISRIDAAWHERRILAYKHFTYTHVLNDGRDEHYLLDRQFGGVAAVLEPDEATAYRSLPTRPAASVLPRPEIAAIASECPNCGWELALAESERIAFCPTCRSAVEIAPKGLSRLAYGLGEATPQPGTEWLYLPFWSFPFRITTARGSCTRIWDWLEQISPQPAALAHREQDPAEARLYLPARHVHGTRELDDAFAALVAWASWRQPRLGGDRTTVVPGACMLGTEVDRRAAADLAPFALLALHDAQSTRRLNGRSFREAISGADLELGEAGLVALPVPLRNGRWCPGGGLRDVSAAALRSDVDAPRVTRSFGLRG